MLIRAALPDEASPIRAVVVAAFGRPDEADLIERLREARDVLFELVADDGGAIVGHVLFCRLDARPERAIAGLAPLSVAPDRHRQGLGARLCEAGLRLARRQDLEAVLVLGDPLYYGRFGFSHVAAAQVASPFSARDGFQALALQAGVLDEPVSVTYPAAFG